jgi:hypothetical protein
MPVELGKPGRSSTDAGKKKGEKEKKVAIIVCVVNFSSAQTTERQTINPTRVHGDDVNAP